MDDELNRVWTAAREALEQEAFEELLASQRAWLERRDALAESTARHLASVEIGKAVEASAAFWQARTWLTEARSEYIRAWLFSFATRPDVQGRWQGIWVDGQGGSIAIVEAQEGRLHFRIDVTRLPNVQTGSVSGEATIRDNTAYFSVTPEGADAATAITFVESGAKLVVTSVNAGYFHGMNAHFDGEYVRLTGDLDPDTVRAIEESIGPTRAQMFDIAASGTASELRSALNRWGSLRDLRTDDGESLLMIAASQNGDPSVVLLLLQAGESPASRDTRGRTALHYAAENANPSATRLLLAAGADPNVADRASRATPLLLAAEHGNWEVARLLLSAGADPDATDLSGFFTPLRIAAYRGHAEVVDALLDFGADATRTDPQGNRAIDLVPHDSKLRRSSTYWRLNDASFY